MIQFSTTFEFVNHTVYEDLCQMRKIKYLKLSPEQPYSNFLELDLELGLFSYKKFFDLINSSLLFPYMQEDERDAAYHIRIQATDRILNLLETLKYWDKDDTMHQIISNLVLDAMDELREDFETLPLTIDELERRNLRKLDGSGPEEELTLNDSNLKYLYPTTITGIQPLTGEHKKLFLLMEKLGVIDALNEKWVPAASSNQQNTVDLKDNQITLARVLAAITRYDSSEIERLRECAARAYHPRETASNPTNAYRNPRIMSEVDSIIAQLNIKKRQSTNSG